ncbi:Asp-tRNA(Asn)/Glu-tRNA(Gln) amidotransferase subunit GatC [Dentiradicibacter hellwigii]|jgi:aspartyl/glutamyl-tRNA(asn/gln) amidotransferase, C subunit|uniref:Aspartyl/glutamyl-tRNA(Asn/Gln) amidotransferase subunit C n=1 Tax=Dentiradicibacter hellwigii TaxID=3149053 RepID=A0ABV4UIG1_9RHOO
MSITHEHVKRVAQLAQLEISADENETIRAQLDDIIGLIEQLQAVDTHGVEPMAHVLDLGQRLRPDIVTESNRREDFLAIAPQTEAGLFIVPKVIE